MEGSPSPSRNRVSRWTLARRGAAVAVAVVGAAVTLIGIVLPDDLGCSHSTVEETTAAEASVQERAERIGIVLRTAERTTTDPSVSTTTTTSTSCSGVATGHLVPLALLVGVLLVPDMSELAIPGLITLKRRVEQQEDLVAVQGERQSDLERRVLLLQMNASASATVNMNFGTFLEDLPRKEERFRRGETLDERELVVSVDPQIAAREQELLALTERLRTYEDMASARTLQSTVQAALLRWRQVFAPELAALRATRDKVAHPPHNLSGEQLEQAVALAQRLVRLLDDVLAGRRSR